MHFSTPQSLHTKRSSRGRHFLKNGKSQVWVWGLLSTQFMNSIINRIFQCYLFLVYKILNFLYKAAQPGQFYWAIPSFDNWWGELPPEHVPNFSPFKQRLCSCLLVGDASCLLTNLTAFKNKFLNWSCVHFYYYVINLSLSSPRSSEG